jgi:probable HAF family extracellular repeat protein
MKRHVFAAAFGALLVVLPVRHALRADAALYTVEDLGLIDGAAPTVTGINASGQLSGHVPGGMFGLPQAVRYTNERGWEYIPGVGTFYSLATGINDQGDIVGYAHDGTTRGFRAFRYTPGPGVSLIDPLPGGTMSLGHAIDAAGNVVGQSDSAAGPVAFRAAPGLPAVALSTVGGTPTTACAINATGQVAGYGANEVGQARAFRLEADNSVNPIVAFDGVDGSIEACALDAAGRVGGKATSGGIFRAFTFSSGSPVNVDTFAASVTSEIEGISAGVAVGWFLLGDGTYHAFVNTTEDGSSDLNDLLAPDSGWNLDQAFAVNASGTIAGSGRLNGQPRVFRLTPVADDNDTTAPTITALSAAPSTIVPPNNAMVDVVISAAATDDRDPSPVCSVTGIDGHGAPATDYSVVGPLAGWVRAKGGATYSFAVSCRDAAGNAASGSVDVVVPPDTTAPVINSVSADPSTIWPPNGALVPVTVAVSATDNVDATPSCELTSVSGTSLSFDDYAITGPLSAKLRALSGRTYTLNVKCSDTAGNHSSAAVAVFVPPDTTAPVISEVVASPSVIWPPNGKMVTVNLGVTAGDDVDDAPQCALKSIVSNGGAASDAVVTGPFSASVRAERNDNGSLRTYTLKVACWDAAGNKSWGSATVVVNKDGPVAKAVYKGLLVKVLKKKALLTRKLLKGYFSRGSSR